jgi:AraC-like DNA-binding protein/ubiquinone/menaquinone biosynthesis C-methylase UbiE
MPVKWDVLLNKAIDYIENNLDGEIDADTVAKIMCQPKTVFQRSFSLFMNISMYEYIRKRRMTLAAVMLRNGGMKVIDIALRLGYESPEAFTRAFKEIHGITPTEARNRNTRLNLFPRITCILTLKGEIEMEADYKIKNVDGCEINWNGVDWEAFPPPPNYGVTDRWIETADIWKNAGHVKMLDLASRIGHSSVYFAQRGFDVSAIDISEYAIQYLRDWAAKGRLTINAEVGDMHEITFPANHFDCLFAYHAVSHTNTLGVKKVIAEIERVLKPNGGLFLSFSSKDSREFTEKSWQTMDENTLICPHPAEKGIPHFYAGLSDIDHILSNFTIDNISHFGYFTEKSGTGQKFYYITARRK